MLFAEIGCSNFSTKVRWISLGISVETFRLCLFCSSLNNFELFGLQHETLYAFKYLLKEICLIFPNINHPTVGPRLGLGGAS